MPDFVSMKKTHHTNQQEVHLEGRLAEFRQALKDEIKAIEKNGHSTTILKNGEKVKNGERDYWYRFFVDYMPVMPADTPCKLTIGKDTYEVTVVSCTDDYIIVSSSSPLPDALGYVKMENGSTVLMELLIKRIETNSEKSNPAGTRMLQEQSDTTSVFKKLFDYSSSQLTLSSHNTADQANAVLQAIQNDITYIWGPPGTGKTTVIGQIVHNLLKQNRSVLLVSHTNTAVDGAIKKTDEILGDHPEDSFSSYPLLRIGIPAKEIPEKAKLEHHIHERGRDIEAQLTQLNTEKNELIDRIQQLQMIYMKIKWLADNKLGEINNVQRIIVELEKSCAALEQEVSALQSRYDTLCMQHPAYREHEELLKEKESLEREYSKYSSKKESTVSTIAQLERDIPLYQDELAKHQKKAELRKEIESSVSEKSLKSQIQEQEQNKDYTRNPSQPYPYDGVLRCGKCNGEFHFEMKTQPRWVCQTNSKHYQNVRKNDMKLPRMLELIPKKDQKRVQEYFLNGQQTLFDVIDSTQEPNEPVKPKAKKVINNKGTSNSTHSAKQIKVTPTTASTHPFSSNARAILQMTDTGKIIKEYPSVAAAVKETGINSKSIRDAAKGIQKHAGGYCWKYKG